VLHRLVDSQQMAFIKGRQIMDVVLIANKCVKSLDREASALEFYASLIYRRAYEHLNWNFLLLMM